MGIGWLNGSMGAQDGTVTTKAAPAPGVLSTVSVPPWPCVTMSCERLKPSPVPEPVGFVVKNGSKIFSRTSSGMPGPLSATRISTCPCSRRVVTVTFGAYLPFCEAACA